MRILHVVGSLGMGGTERQLLGLVPSLEEDGASHCRILTLRNRIHQPYLGDRPIDIHSLDRRGRLDPSVPAGIVRHCREWGPDVIHAWDHLSALLSIPAKKMLGVPLLNGSIRDARHWRRFSRVDIVSRVAFRFSDRIVANSRAGLLAYGVPTSRSLCIHNGFDMEKFTGVSTKGVSEGPALSSGPYVAMVANTTPSKDHPTLVRAAAVLADRFESLTFVLIGNGTREPRCTELVPNGLRERFLFLGPRDDVALLLPQMDVCVLVTTEHLGEGLPNAVMEYMAMARPIVATRLGGIPELISDEKSGLLVAPGDAAALARQISRLLEDPGLARRLGEEARARLTTEFTQERMVRAYRETYCELVARNRPF